MTRQLRSVLAVGDSIAHAADPSFAWKTVTGVLCPVILTFFSREAHIAGPDPRRFHNFIGQHDIRAESAAEPLKTLRYVHCVSYYRVFKDGPGFDYTRENLAVMRAYADECGRTANFQSFVMPAPYAFADGEGRSHRPGSVVVTRRRRAENDENGVADAIRSGNEDEQKEKFNELVELVGKYRS